MINIETIYKWWNIFVGEGKFTEVRILGRYQYSGYFKSLDTLVKALEPFSNMEDEQVYFVLNKIDDACYGRQQAEKFVQKPKITTNDTDIIGRQWVMCDFDPIRKSGTNSNNEELEWAHKKAQEVFSFLSSKGFEEPVVCMSGNGWHLMYKIQEDVSEDTREVIKGFLKYMASQFSDEHVDFDPKNFNESRICKLYGTTAKKGANLEDRPWRESTIVYVPQEIKTTPLEKFRELALLAPKEEPKTSPNRNLGRSRSMPFDLPAWLNSYGIVYREKSKGGSTMYELEYCPWVDTHSDKKKWDSALFVDAQGKITFNCTHSHCKDKTWFDVREHYEPDAYTRQQWQPQQPIFLPSLAMPPRKPIYEIKEEIPELGGKWLSLSDIKKVDLSSMSYVKTGFTVLDKNIVGLCETEVSIVSGNNASGKSSWLNTLLLNIIDQDKKGALWSGELPAPILKTWIQMVAAGKSNLRLSKYGDGKYFVPDQVGEKIDRWTKGKLFLYNNEYGNTWKQIFHDMEELLKVGVRIFILDNLFSLDIDLLDGDKNNKQKKVILQIKDFAKKNGAHVILVAHPRKTTAFLRKNDISGSSDLQNAVDNIFIIHRVNNDFFRAGADFFGQKEINHYQGYGNVIEVAKNRMYGVVDLMVGLQYEIESRRFLNEIGENKRYGWEIPPQQSNISFTPSYPKQEDNGMPFPPMTSAEECPY